MLRVRGVVEPTRAPPGFNFHGTRHFRIHISPPKNLLQSYWQQPYGEMHGKVTLSRFSLTTWQEWQQLIRALHSFKKLLTCYAVWHSSPPIISVCLRPSTYQDNIMCLLMPSLETMCYCFECYTHRRSSCHQAPPPHPPEQLVRLLWTERSDWTSQCWTELWTASLNLV